MNKALAVLLFIITIPFVLLGLLVFGIIYVLTTVIPAPVEILIYKSSDFYKDFKIKYFLGVTSNFGYKSYKYVKQNGEVDLVFQSEGYYYYKTKGAVLVIPYYPGYFFEDGEWWFTPNEGKTHSKISELKATFAPLIKENIDSLDLKLLVKEKHFAEKDLPAAKSHPVFVFYKNHKDLARIKA